jgi:hypothetical protein
VTNGEHWTSCLRHDLVRCRHRKMRCCTGCALPLPHAQNDEIRFPQRSEFQNFLSGAAYHDVVFGLNLCFGFPWNDLAQEFL